MTKRQNSMINNYNNAKHEYLWQAYKTCSHDKQRAYMYCMDVQKALNGYGGKITGVNCFSFVYAFKFKNENDIECLYYITKDNQYIIPLE